MLQIKQLNKAFSNKQIFKNFNYTLETHDHLLISGVSGSGKSTFCLLYTSPSPRDQRGSRMPSSA